MIWCSLFASYNFYWREHLLSLFCNKNKSRYRLFLLTLTFWQTVEREHQFISCYDWMNPKVMMFGAVEVLLTHFSAHDWLAHRVKQLHAKFLRRAVAADGSLFFRLRTLVAALLLLSAFVLHFIQMIHSGQITLASMSSCSFILLSIHLHTQYTDLIILTFSVSLH